MQRVSLEVETREKSGSRESRRLRRSGKVPAVLYGYKIDDLKLVVDGPTVEKLVGNEGFHGLIDLKIQGDSKASKSKEPFLVLLKEYQADILTRQLTHIDFYKVNLQEKVTVSIPIHTEGTAPGVKEGGILELVRRELEVRCLPTTIPDAITVDISQLQVGDSIHVQDLTLPEGVETLAETNFTIIAVASPTKEEEAPAPVEGEAPPEGAEAEASGETPAAGETKEAGGTKEAKDGKEEGKG